MTKYVYLFKEGNANMRELLGGKGANLAEMTNLGLPVPQGFTVTTEACTRYYEDGKKIDDEIVEQIYAASGQDGGDRRQEVRRSPRTRFLVSVRSGARASMPGMMDTILNLGLNDVVVEGPGQDDQQPPLRLRLLPPFHPDVLRRCYGDPEEQVRR